MKRATLSNIRVIPALSGDDVIDRQGFLSAVVAATVTAVGSNPVLKFKVQHCDTEAGTFEDITDTMAFLHGAGGTVAQDQTYNIDLDLLGCKQYIKIIPQPSAGVTAEYAVALGDNSAVPV